jgi:hypothetical protein
MCVLGFGKRGLKAIIVMRWWQRGAIVTTNITHIVRVVDARKIMKLQYENNH